MQRQMLTCNICGYEHPSMISPSHLKRHNITGAEYKAKYPDAVLRVQTPEARAKMAASKAGKTAWNKGLKTGPNLNLSAAKKGKSNTAAKGKERSAETKMKISLATKGKSLTSEQRARWEDAMTRVRSAPDFTGPMSGKMHSPETKQKISEASAKVNAARRQKALQELQTKLAQDELTVTDIAPFKVNLTCKKCNLDFVFSRQYFAASSKKLHNSRSENICPACYPRVSTKSRKELEIFEYVQTITDENVKSGNRTEIYPRELDIYFPDRKLAIEFCGNYWHAENISSQYGRTKFHIHEKMIECEKRGIRLITIFEDEWNNHQEIVKSRLANLLGKINKKIFARKLVISQITTAQSSAFLKVNHIQGADKPELALGAFFGEDLVSVMTFKKTSFVKGGTGAEWELNRFASAVGYTLPGVASRLLSAFRKKFNPENLPIISYSDNRWSVGDVYKTLGFKKVGSSPPGYWYTPVFSCDTQGERIHRSNFMRHRLHSIFKKPYQKPECKLSEWAIMQLEKFDRIWDCGTTKWMVS